MHIRCSYIEPDGRKCLGTITVPDELYADNPPSGLKCSKHAGIVDAPVGSSSNSHISGADFKLIWETETKQIAEFEGPRAEVLAQIESHIRGLESQIERLKIRKNATNAKRAQLREEMGVDELKAISKQKSPRALVADDSPATAESLVEKAARNIAGTAGNYKESLSHVAAALKSNVTCPRCKESIAMSGLSEHLKGCK